MKGDINPIIFAILAVGIVVVAIFLLSGNIGRFIARMSVEECKQKMQVLCSSFRTTGNPVVFRDVPQTCAEDLKVSSLFKACIGGSVSQCENLCESIEIGIISPKEEVTGETEASEQS